MKYRGRSASDVFEEELPKEDVVQEVIEVENAVNKNVEDEVNEFKEAEVEAGDQNMPSKPAPSIRPKSGKPKALAKPKPD
jgi:hypothetical protein